MAKQTCQCGGPLRFVGNMFSMQGGRSIWRCEKCAQTAYGPVGQQPTRKANP